MGSEKSPMNGQASPHNGDRHPEYGSIEDVNAREIEADIDRTRRHMDETLDQLSERLSPHHLVDDVLDFMKAKGRSINSENVTKLCMKGGKTLGQFVKEHPGPALMAGAGVFWYFLEWSREGELQGKSRIESVSPRNEIWIEEESAIIYDPYDELSVGVSERARTMDEAEIAGIELSFEDGKPGLGRRLKDKASHAAERVGEMGANLKDAVEDRASHFKDVVEDMKDSVGERAIHLKETVGEQASHLKESVGTKAHRVGEKVGEVGERIRHGVSDSVQQAGESLSDFRHRISRKAHRAADRASEFKGRTVGSLKDGAHRAALGAGRLGGKVRRGARRTGHRIADGSARLGHWVEHTVEDVVHESDRRARQAFDESPLGVGLAVAGLGLLMGALFPSTKVEDQVIGEKAADLKLDLKMKGEEMKVRGELAAKRVASAAADKAKRAGLSAQHVLETIDHVVSDVKEAAMEALGEALVDVQEAASQALTDEGMDPRAVKGKARAVVNAARDAMCSKSHEHSDLCRHGSVDQERDRKL